MFTNLNFHACTMYIRHLVLYTVTYIDCKPRSCVWIIKHGPPQHNITGVLIHHEEVRYGCIGTHYEISQLVVGCLCIKTT